jgi:hypothetical protein
VLEFASNFTSLEFPAPQNNLLTPPAFTNCSPGLDPFPAYFLDNELVE